MKFDHLNFRQSIEQLVEDCRLAVASGASLDEVRRLVLPERVRQLLTRITPADFLDRIKEDRDFSFYYYDVQQEGLCAKPREAASLILEYIVIETLSQ